MKKLILVGAAAIASLLAAFAALCWQPALTDVAFSEPVYIKWYGSVEPSAAPISTLDNVTYIFTDNIRISSYGIVIERSNIVVDGNGYSLYGTGYAHGFTLENVDNVTIKNVDIEPAPGGIYSYVGAGIYVNNSQNNRIHENMITKCYYGISAGHLSYSSIYGNNITANREEGISLRYALGNDINENHIEGNSKRGIELEEYSTSNHIHGNYISSHEYYGIFFDSYCDFNTIYENYIAGSMHGVGLRSINNTFHHNIFADNDNQVQITSTVYANFWDNGYPSGGNYWDDYLDVDQYSGATQDEPGADGIWDHPYTMNETNQDNYPLVPEFPTWTTTLLMLAVLTIATAFCRRRVSVRNK